MDKLFAAQTEQTPLGAVWVALLNNNLVAVEIGGDEDTFSQGLAARFGISPTFSEIPTRVIISQIEAYLLGKRQTFEFPIHWEALAAFQQKVLRTVHSIPYGETRSYGQIAAQIGAPRAARAVGRANATNPMPLVIPCHRLVGSDGSLRGYGSGEGIKTKAWLLDFERINKGNK